MSLSIPFSFWVAAEQNGGQGIAGLPLLGRDSFPPLMKVWYSHIYAEKGR